MSEAGAEGLARVMGLLDALMYGIGAMIGAGIFVLSGHAIADAGPAAVLSFVLCGVITSFTGLVYAELASMIPEAGGGYSFISEAFGGLVSRLSGWLFWMAYTVSGAFYAMGFAAYFSTLIKAPRRLIAVALIGVLTLVNALGARKSSRTQRVIVLCKLLVLVVFVAFSLPRVRLDEYREFAPYGWLAPIAVSSYIFVAFEGYDVIPTTAEEMRDPRVLPKAILLSILVATSLYVSVVAALVGLRGYWIGVKGSVDVAIATAAANAIGPWMYLIILVGALASTSSALNSTLFASSRILFAMARRGDAPRALSAVDPRRRTPVRSTLATATLMTLLCLMGAGVNEVIEVLGAMSSAAFLVCFALVDASLILIRRRKHLEGAFRTPLYPLTPILGIASSLALLLAAKPIALLSIAAYALVIALATEVHARRLTFLCKLKRVAKLL